MEHMENRTRIKRKLGINAGCLVGITPYDALPLLKKAGFESFFTALCQKDAVAALRARADELGLDFDFIHAPFKGINDMWLSGMDYLTIFNGIKEAIDSAAAYNVPLVITHVSTGWNAPAVNDLGLSRYDELVLYAKERGVILAFENLRMVGNLAILIDRYEKVDNVGFCFDCGHEHCFTKSVRWLDVFGEKVCCTHIHDNYGREWGDYESHVDLHLLPFDGTYDYAPMMERLDRYGFEGSLMLEVFQKKPQYETMAPEEVLATAYERIKKISEM